jgi:hypothetical protein
MGNINSLNQINNSSNEIDLNDKIKEIITIIPNNQINDNDLNFIINNCKISNSFKNNENSFFISLTPFAIDNNKNENDYDLIFSFDISPSMSKTFMNDYSNESKLNLILNNFKIFLKNFDKNESLIGINVFSNTFENIINLHNFNFSNKDQYLTLLNFQSKNVNSSVNQKIFSEMLIKNFQSLEKSKNKKKFLLIFSCFYNFDKNNINIEIIDKFIRNNFGIIFIDFNYYINHNLNSLCEKTFLFNYIHIKNENDLKNLFSDNFKYSIEPLFHNFDINIKSNDFEIINFYGIEKKDDKFHKENIFPTKILNSNNENQFYIKDKIFLFEIQFSNNNFLNDKCEFTLDYNYYNKLNELKQKNFDYKIDFNVDSNQIFIQNMKNIIIFNYMFSIEKKFNEEINYIKNIKNQSKNNKNNFDPFGNVILNYEKKEIISALKNDVFNFKNYINNNFEDKINNNYNKNFIIKELDFLNNKIDHFLVDCEFKDEDEQIVVEMEIDDEKNN